ncbi:MAG TPA: hypothetical protein VHV55_01545 [Pirellulales bacterium]|nr:hypothetical protein [Pirellulales bacterium]
MCKTACADCVATNQGSSCRMIEAALTAPASLTLLNDSVATPQPADSAQPARQRVLARRIGLTLIELVVVMVILTTLAAMLIPKLGFMQQQAMSAAGAATAQDITNNIETFRMSSASKFYPQGFDSLLAAGGGGLMTGLIQGPGGTPPAMPFVAGTLADPYAQASFGMAFGTAAGTYNVYDQDAGYAAAGEDVSSSFNTARELYSTGGIATVPLTGNGVVIWQAAFPGGAAAMSTDPTPVNTYTPPASAVGAQLIAFGIGPNCKAVGQTMSTAPLQVGQQPGYYARYYAVFALYGTGNPQQGKAADLKLVLDSEYNTIASNVSLYNQAAPSDN